MPNDVLNESWAKEGRQTAHTVQEPCVVCHGYVERLATFVKLWTKNVPPSYRQFILRTLAPCEAVAERVPLERQQRIINAIRENPGKGYAFFGPPQAGKTVMTTALYTEQLWKEVMQTPHLDSKARKWFPVWRISTKRLLDEHTDWSMHRNDKVEDGQLPPPLPR